MATLEELYELRKQNKKPQNNGMTLEDFYSGNVDSADDPEMDLKRRLEIARNKGVVIKPTGNRAELEAKKYEQFERNAEIVKNAPKQPITSSTVEIGTTEKPALWQNTTLTALKKPLKKKVDFKKEIGSFLYSFGEGLGTNKIADLITNSFDEQIKNEVKQKLSPEEFKEWEELRKYVPEDEFADANPIVKTVGNVSGAISKELIYGLLGQKATSIMLSRAPWLVNALGKTPGALQALSKGGITGANVWGMKQLLEPEDRKPGLKELPTTVALWAGGGLGGELTSQALNSIAPQLSKIPGLVKVVKTPRGTQTLQIAPVVEGVIREMGENMVGTIAALPTVPAEERKQFLQEFGPDLLAEGILEVITNFVTKTKGNVEIRDVDIAASKLRNASANSPLRKQVDAFINESIMNGDSESIIRLANSLDGKPKTTTNPVEVNSGPYSDKEIFEMISSNVQVPRVETPAISNQIIDMIQANIDAAKMNKKQPVSVNEIDNLKYLVDGDTIEITERNPIRGDVENGQTVTSTEYYNSNLESAARNEAGGIPFGIEREVINRPISDSKNNQVNPQKQAGLSIFEYVEGRKELPNDVAQLESLLKEVENIPKDRFGFDLQFFAEQIKEKIRKLSKTKSNTINRYVGFDDQTKQFLEDAGFEYDPETNQEQMQRALNNLNTNKADVINRFENDNKAFSDATQVFEAKKLIDEIYQNKDISKLNDYTKHYAERMRENARALQATDAAWEKTKDPVSAIIKAQRVINNAKKLFEEYGWKWKPPELTDADIQIIIDQMEAAKGFPDGSYEQQAAVARVQQLIADKMPKTMRDKLLGLQRISLILNPKTLITRNPLSNVLIQSLESVRENTVGALIDSITSGIRGSKRTQIAAPIQKTRAYLGGVKKGVVEFGKDIKNKVDTSPSRGQAEMPKGRTFKNRFLNELDNITKSLLQIGDRPFYQGAYDSRIKELQLINKTNEITDDMKIDARLYALDKVFQNDSDLSKRANQLKNALGFFGDIAIPFTQTPANVLDKMLDYSPAGLGKALYHLGRTKGGKAFNQKLFVDRLSRSLTGTGIIMIGYVLAAKGLVTGKDDENEKVRNFKRAAGYSPYAFKIGNGFYTFDWAQPFGGMLAAGADAYLGGLGKDDFLSKVTGTAEGLTNTFFNLSFLQGLTRLLSGYSPAASIGNTLLSAPQQAAPTAGKQIAQLIDPVVRETKGNNPFETAKNRVVSRIPFASKTLPAKVDVFGEDIEYYQGRNNFFNVMLNPGFYTELKNDPATKLLLDVYNETGETDVLPKLAPEYINKNGKKIYLTAKQKIEFQKIYGKRLKTELSKLKLNGLTPNAKATVLSQKVMAIYNLSKVEFMNKL